MLAFNQPPKTFISINTFLLSKKGDLKMPQCLVMKNSHLRHKRVKKITILELTFFSTEGKGLPIFEVTQDA